MLMDKIVLTRNPTLPLTLGLGVSRGSKMDWGTQRMRPHRGFHSAATHKVGS